MMKNHGIVAIIIKNKKFLLLKDARNLMFNYWAPPHGRCNNSDASERNSVIREVREETSLHVKPIKKIWTIDADTKVKTVSFWSTEIVDGEINIDKRESSEYGWFTLGEALKLKLYPGTKKFFVLLKEEKLALPGFVRLAQ